MMTITVIIQMENQVRNKEYLHYIVALYNIGMFSFTMNINFENSLKLTFYSTAHKQKAK